MQLCGRGRRVSDHVKLIPTRFLSFEILAGHVQGQFSRTLQDLLVIVVFAAALCSARAGPLSYHYKYKSC
jgi:hypothetical protein